MTYMFYASKDLGEANVFGWHCVEVC